MNDYNSFNQVILIGRIGADPELKTSKGKNPQDFVRFSVATYQKFKSGTKTTTWTQCSYWGDSRAQWAQQYVKKGMLMLVKGKLDSRTWTDTSGNKHKVVELKVLEMVFMGSPGDRAGAEDQEEQTHREQNEQQNVQSSPELPGDSGTGQITDEEEDAAPSIDIDEDFF